VCNVQISHAKRIAAVNLTIDLGALTFMNRLTLRSCPEMSLSKAQLFNQLVFGAGAQVRRSREFSSPSVTAAMS
jgi:hypothetical protein